MQLEHRHHPPLADDGSDAPPLIVLLHGYGASRDDLLDLGHALDPRFRVVAPNAPIDLGPMGMPGGRAWFNLYMTPTGIEYDQAGALEATRIAAAFVREAMEAWPCDPERVLVLGFSQGAMMAHAMVLDESMPIAGAMCCSGRMVESLFRDELTLERRRGFPLFASHGTLDDVIPVDRGRAIRDWYAARPVDLEYHEYDVGHGIPPECLVDLRRWVRARLDPAD